jgi:SlyX protein
MESRVAELELKLNVAEDHLEALNRVVFRQQEQLDLLQGQLRELHRQMRALAAADSSAPVVPGDELPPHY